MTERPTDLGEIRKDIEETRAELAETVDALAAKLDVKAQARHRAQEAADHASAAFDRAKAAAPEPVQHALDRAGEAARPAVAKAKSDPKRTALIAGGLLLALLVIRRLTR
jgi:hypothetical protein